VNVAYFKSIKFVIIGICCFIFLLCWALSSPPGSNSDDEYHLAGIWCAYGDRPGVCAVDEFTGQKSVPMQIQRYSGPQGIFCFAGKEQASGRCIRELSSDVILALTPTDRISAGQYPSGFYKVNGLLVGHDINRSILAMRFMQILIAIALFSVALYTVRDFAAQVLVALLVGSVPIGLWVIPSTQPSSWSVVGLICLLIFCVGIIHNQGIANILVASIGSCLSLIIAMQSRRDSILMIFFIATIVLVSQNKQLLGRRDNRKLSLVILSILGLLVVLINFRFKAICSFFDLTVFSAPNFFEGLTSISPKVVFGLIGGSSQLGTPDFAPYLIVPLLMTFGLGTFAFNLWVATSKETKIATLIGITLLFLLPLRFFTGNVGEPVSRYIYAIYLAVLIVLSIGTTIGSSQVSSNQIVSAANIFCIVSIAHAFALHSTLRRYLTGTGTKRFDLNFGAEWWWSNGLSPMSVWLIGVLSFSASLYLAITIDETKIR